MEMYQIRYVLAAAEHLNFTRAAAQCGVSQPALTKGIRALEADLKVPLFHRDGRRIVVSRFGAMVLPHLRRIADETAAAQVLSKQYSAPEQLCLRIAVHGSIGPRRLAPLFDRYVREHGDVDLVGAGQSVQSIVDKLLLDAIDFGIVVRDDAAMQALTLLPLYSEGHVVLLASGHPLASREHVTLGDLAGLDFVDGRHGGSGDAISAALADRSLMPVTRLRADREDWVEEMVVAGLGFAIMPEGSVLRTDLSRVPLAEPQLERQICLASVAGRAVSPGLEAFAQHAQSLDWAA